MTRISHHLPIQGSSPNDGTLITSELINTAELTKFSRAVTCQFIFAARLIQQKPISNYIQERLEHGNIQITMDVYGSFGEGDYWLVVRCLDSPVDNQSATHPQLALGVTHVVRL